MLVEHVHYEYEFEFHDRMLPSTETMHPSHSLHNQLDIHYYNSDHLVEVDRHDLHMLVVLLQFEYEIEYHLHKIENTNPNYSMQILHNQ